MILADVPVIYVTDLPSNEAVMTAFATGPEIMKSMITAPLIEVVTLADVMWFVAETCLSQNVCQMPEFWVWKTQPGLRVCLPRS